MLSRRKFLSDAALIAAGAIMTPEGLWMPGEKLISIAKEMPMTLVEFYDGPQWPVEAFAQEWINDQRSRMIFNTIVAPATLRA